MSYRQLIYLTLMGVVFLMPSQSYSQALHWLSQIQSDVGPVHNTSNSFTSDSKISANGRYLSFVSRATNIVENDINSAIDVFVYDRLTDQVKRANVTDDNQPATRVTGGRLSAPTSDGSLVAFTSSGDFGFGDLNNAIYTKNFNTGELKLISLDDNDQTFEVLNSITLLDDGSAVYFFTNESLVVQDTNTDFDIYAKDLIDNSITLMSVSNDSNQSSNGSVSSAFSVSANGRYVAFSTDGDNLINKSVQGFNVYLRDTVMQTTGLISSQPNGMPSVDITGGAFTPSVSNSGSVVYVSDQDDLVANDTNDSFDAFLFDGTSTTRINLDANGMQLPNGSQFFNLRINATGERIFFVSTEPFESSDDNGEEDVYQYQVNNGIFSRLNGDIGNDDLRFKDISASGEWALMRADATEVSDVVSISTVFGSGLFLHNTNDNMTQQVEPVAFNPRTVIAAISGFSMSSDQRYAIFDTRSPNLLNPLETDTDEDTILIDRQDDSRHIIGSKSNAQDISSNGRYIVIGSRYFQPSGIVDLGAENLFLHDRDNNNYLQIAIGNSAQVNDAGMVVFVTEEGLAPNDTDTDSDVYLFNPANSSIDLISQSVQGMVSNNDSIAPHINDDENAISIVFSSRADNLVAADINNRSDVFLADWPSGTITRVSQTPAFVGGNGDSFFADISADGLSVAFTSEADNLTNDITTDGSIYIYERLSQSLDLAVLNVSPLSLGISDSGQFITFNTDVPIVSLGAEGYQLRTFLIDLNTDELSWISQPLDGSVVDDSSSNAQVYEDLSLSPPRVGVSFLGLGSSLTGLFGHAGFREAFLYQQGGPDVELSIEVIGSGSVGGNFGISCMSTCDSSYPLGTALTLVATAETGFIFDRWFSSNGQCMDDSNPCQLTMDQDKTLQAIFIDENDIIFDNGFE